MRNLTFRSQRTHRRSATYRRSLLLGWTASLGVLLLVVHLPFSNPVPRVGWGAAGRASEHIPLTALDDTSPDDATPSASDAAPPATQHVRPAAPPAPPLVSASPEHEASSSDAPSRFSAPETVWSVADLSAEDRRPYILGGPGALQLHIHYPAAAREQGIAGRLTVTFTVHPDGWARRIRVTEPLHPLCDSAAVAAIRAVRFGPGTYDGTPVPVRMSLPVRFQLQPYGTPSPERRRTASTPTAPPM